MISSVISGTVNLNTFVGMYRFFQKNLILVVIGLYSKKIKLKSVKGNIKLKL